MVTQRNHNIIIGSQFSPVVNRYIASASLSIKMVVFCWLINASAKCIPLLLLNNALQNAKRRGVVVQCLTGSEGLTRAIIAKGFDAKLCTQFKIVHAKMILIDDKILICGSHNLSKSGLTSNLELSVVSFFDDCNNDVSRFFDSLWSGC
jgi:phosphatidylserine/phosphatidylglycerophosphate/cardiolipin synthase-like enzyme